MQELDSPLETEETVASPEDVEIDDSVESVDVVEIVESGVVEATTLEETAETHAVVEASASFVVYANLPRSVAFSRCPTIPEALARMEPADPLLLRRMTETRLTATLQERCTDFPDPLLMLAVIGADLPDTIGVLPLWVALARACPRGELRVVGEEEYPLLERLLGGGETAFDPYALEMPVLLFLDEELQLQAQWGPRPQAAEAFVEEWLAQHPDFERLAEEESEEGIAAFAALNRNLGEQMRIWYNSGLDKAACDELEALLASLQSDADAGEGSPLSNE